MKKITFLLVGLLVGFTAFSQTERATEFFSEDFSSGVPPTGWTIDGVPEQWSQSGTSAAGGEAPEAKLHWIQGTHTTRLISPVVDLTGATSLVFSFKQFLSDYSGEGYTIGVSTRSGSGAWTDVWSLDPSGNIAPETKSIVLTGGDVGASDFQICLFLTGNFYNFNDWYIDDVVMFSPHTTDATVTSINTPAIAASGDIDISCTFKNVGLDMVTSLDLNYEIDGGTVVTQNVSGLSIELADSMNFTFDTSWAATAGDYSLEVWLSNVNGGGDDNDTSNDQQSMDISIATQSTQNLPLFEEFTSSTCGPCAGFNSGVFNPFMEAHPDDIAVIKYQMSWPAPGDDYYTEEGGVRRSYYGVNGVPSIFAGGLQYSTSTAGVTSAFNTESEKEAFFAMTNTLAVDGDNVTVTVNITPYISTEKTVYIVVLEKETLNNTGNNGETSFENVMMKMLPDAEGTLVDFQSGTDVEIIETYDMSTTHVEEMDDLLVVVFIQNYSTKEILQASYNGQPLGNQDNVFENVSLYPNPSNGYLNVVTNKELEVSVYDVLGKNVFSKNITTNEVLDLTALNNGMYFVKLNDGVNHTTKKILINK